MSELDKLRSKYYYYRNYNKENEKYVDPEFTLDFFIFKLSTEPCLYCGTRDDLGFDRIKKSEGYTATNVIVSCKKCTWGRSHRNLSHKAMIEIGEVIKNNRKEMKENER